MDEPSRRAVLGCVGAGVGGLLAGCTAPTAGRESTPEPVTDATPTATATPTPAPDPETPDFWGFLPTPTALGGDYSFGSLTLPDLRSAGSTPNGLAPARFTPAPLHEALDDTRDLLTVNTGSVAGGVLRGTYDVGALEAAFEESDLRADDAGVYLGDRLGFALGAGRIRWADDPRDPTAILDVFSRQLAGEADSYPGTVPPVAAVLSVVRGAASRFGRPITVEDGPFATARFLANGFTPTGDVVRWTSAIAFEGSVPAAAAENYVAAYSDRRGFENLVDRTESGLLVIEADITGDRRSDIQPL